MRPLLKNAMIISSSLRISIIVFFLKKLSYYSHPFRVIVMIIINIIISIIIKS